MKRQFTYLNDSKESRNYSSDNYIRKQNYSLNTSNSYQMLPSVQKRPVKNEEGINQGSFYTKHNKKQLS